MPPAKRGSPPQGKRGMRPQSARSKAASTRKQDDVPAAMIEPDVEIDIEDLQDYDEPANIFLYGPSGVGKTVLASGAPNATFLSTEKGVMSAKRTGSKAKLMRATDWPNAVAGVRKAEMTMGKEDWLVVDSVLKMEILYLRWILGLGHSWNPARDEDIPAPRDYQKLYNGFERWIDRIYDGPFNSILISTSMSVDDAEGETRVIPYILGQKGQVSDYVSSQADIGLYYDLAREYKENRSGPVVRRLLCQPYPPWWAKDRSLTLGNYQDIAEGEFTAMADIIAMIQEGEQEYAAET